VERSKEFILNSTLCYIVEDVLFISYNEVHQWHSERRARNPITGKLIVEYLGL
jgi:hypothetical protein